MKHVPVSFMVTAAWSQAEKLADAGVMNFSEVKDFVSMRILVRLDCVERIEIKRIGSSGLCRVEINVGYILKRPMNRIAVRLSDLLAKRCKTEEDVLKICFESS